MNKGLTSAMFGLLAFALVTHGQPAGETSTTLHLTNGVRVVINRPAKSSGQPVLLVLYALPNGSNIEQTAGHQVSRPENWRDGLQQIAAQTRFVRQALTNREVAVAYLENSLKSWPAWCRTNGKAVLPQIVDRVVSEMGGTTPDLALSGHSGGGAFIFGYLDTLEEIPDRVRRIAFLDSNYAYSADRGHDRKLQRWLDASTNHLLMVLAYDDANGLLDGKPFVSAAGGTWGRSHAMLADLARHYKFTTNAAPPLTTYTALDGRLRLLLRENPERKIYHTTQVERNGFIHSLLFGTPLEGQGYAYLGDRAYDAWIQP